MPTTLPRGTFSRSRQIWALLGMPGHTQPEEVVSTGMLSW